MERPTIKMDRRLIVRIVAIVLVLILAVVMFHIGKEHTILLDNKTVGDYKALSQVNVTIDKLPEIELYPRDRDQAVVTAQNHRIRLVYTDSSYNEVVLEKKLKLPISEKMMLLSIPTLVANPDAPQSEWLTHFEVVPVAPTAEDEQIVTDDTAIGDF